MKKYLLLVILLTTFTICSCSPYVYNPLRMDAPSLHEQGDVEVGVAGAVLGLNAHVAYALSNEWAIKANVSYSDPHYNDSNYMKQSLYEAGFGKYGLFESKLGWQTFFSVAFCKSDLMAPHNRMGGDVDPTSIKSEYLRYTFQGTFITNAIDLEERKHSSAVYFDHSLNGRLSYVQFTSYEEVVNYTNSDSVRYNNHLPTELYFEFSSLLQIGVKMVTLDLQLGLIVPFFSTQYYGEGYFNPLIASAGASFHF